jgi:hypothetical protein
VFFVFFVLSCASTVVAQSVTATLSNVTRVESWSYFEPRLDILALTADTIGDPDYTFVGDRAELGVRVAGSRFDLSGAFNYVRLENLPEDAIGPGGLGAGAFYFAATGLRYSYQLYLGELMVRVKSADERLSLSVGRMPFGRLRPALPKTQPGFAPPGSSLARVGDERLEGRLLGNFEWSYYQRRFDGVRFDLDRPDWHVTGGVFVPTQGGFEESANLSMPKLQVATGSFTHKSARAEWQAFAHLYRDRRSPPMAVVDNTFSPDRPVDVTVLAVGTSHARVAPTAAGELDTVLWGSVQVGDWYGTSHRAGSVAAEAGHRWTQAPLKPWLRGGLLWASGDGDGGDRRHRTFFQMLPSSRQYALSSVYAQMNVRDAFVQAWIEPSRVSARIEVHAVALASGADLWYQGSGATSSSGRYFGFSGRAAGGASSLGTVLEGTVDVPIMNHWSVNGYAGSMWAGDVVRQQFTGKRLTFWYLENVIRF